MSVGNLIDGRAVSAQILSELSARVSALKARGVQPGLAFVRVGEDPASKVYVGRKEKACADLGMFSQTEVLAESASETELLALIAKLNADVRLHGILVQAPLPKQIREAVIYSTVLPQKDVDGFHPVNVGKLMLGDATGFRPCTPAGIQELLLIGTLTVTLMVSPAIAVLTSVDAPLTLIVVVAPVTPWSLRLVLTVEMTVLFEFPGNTPTRHPPRAASVTDCATIRPRPNSKVGTITHRNSRGATIANSTAAAPSSRRSFVRNFMLVLLPLVPPAPQIVGRNLRRPERPGTGRSGVLGR